MFRFLSAAAASGLVFLAAACAAGRAGAFSFAEDAEKGILTIKDGGDDVLAYRFGDQLPPGLDPRFVRSCYIHPLYSLDGLPLTADFPPDHVHHHGVSWTWPVVRTRGIQTQTWHPASLRQHFVRWARRDVSRERAVLEVENVWKLDGTEIVARENVTIGVHRSDEAGRAVDVEIRIEAVGGPLEVQGAPEDNKGYGGLCLRGAPLFTGAALTTDLGPLHGDSVDRRFRWADLSTDALGVAIFVSQDHPGFPTTWLARTSYAGILNPSWPGLEPAVITPEHPVILRYRIFVHRGGDAAGRVAEAYAAFLAENR